MTEPITINPQEPLNPGLDYAFLKVEGTSIVQRLAGEIWTDYNESDPGVTTLEQLCYALTELSYRAELPLEDLLIDPITGKIDPRRQALFPAKRIFPCNPVTENDYRKLIVDRLPEIANVWLTPHKCGTSKRCVQGLWDFELYVPGLEPECPPPGEREQKIRDEVRHLYCRHRNLGEDVRSIRVLRPVRITVKAEVNILEMPAPEAILAGILFNVANFLAPELRRQSLKSLVDAGVPPSEIFDGPLLHNGFIANQQLQPKAETIPVQDIVRVIARSAGVASLRGVKIRVANDSRAYSGNDLAPVPRRSILQLDTRPNGKCSSFSIKLFRNGIEIQPNPARVEREFARLWADQRRIYPLGRRTRRVCRLSQGKYHDVTRYYSIQNQYTNVYGINAYGVAGDATAARKAQAKQLKGYLLVYDQLMANFFAQLAHVRDLFSTAEDAPSTYFYQYLDRAVPNIEPLLVGGEEGYRRGLPEIVQGQGSFVARRSRFLDFLLALYGEDLDCTSVWDLTPCGEEDADTGERLMRAKRALLRHLTASTHNRGRGFDYLERPSRGNVAGLEIKSRIQLGMSAFDAQQHFHAVEHNLLRFGRFRNADPAFVYSFTITVVLSAPPDSNEDYRRFAREVIRENTPAHVVVDVCFLSPEQMCDFESLDRAWRCALREQDRRRIIDTSAALRHFLQERREP